VLSQKKKKQEKTRNGLLSVVESHALVKARILAGSSEKEKTEGRASGHASFRLAKIILLLFIYIILLGKYTRRAHTTWLPCGGLVFVLFSYSKDDMHACRNLTPHADIILLIAKYKYLK
jgi:hypothetical protein